MYQFVNKRKRVIITFITLLIIGGVLFYVPVPYYITQPGSVIELQPIIDVGEGAKSEDGTFMLVTVSMIRGKVAYYLYALVSPTADLVRYDRLLGHDESPQEYRERQLYTMQSSQDDAILAALNYAAEHMDVSAEVYNDGVRVMRITPGMPAENVLQPGDIIHEVDGTEVNTTEQLLDMLKDRKPREQVTLFVEREGEQRQVETTLDVLPTVHNEEDAERRVGLGVYPVSNRVVTSSPRVTIDTNEIGGPSAGLMMALEIYNQLSPTDLTKGYRIAGTGTIDAEGKVGQIGSAAHKVTAADARNTDIFFVPKNVEPTDDNENVALNKARELGTKMKVIPVATLKEAVDYLESLSLASESDT